MKRRDFLETSAAAMMTAILGTYAQANGAIAKKRIAMVGTGIRGTRFWGEALNREFGDLVEFVEYHFTSVHNELRTLFKRSCAPSLERPAGIFYSLAHRFRRSVRNSPELGVRCRIIRDDFFALIGS